jgi:formate hydrogenlyase transcriptional activator
VANQASKPVAGSDIEDPERARSLVAAERRTLEMIARGASLTDILQNLCDAIDAQAPGIISSVLLMDAEGAQLWPTAGRRVPKGWTQTISPLPIGPDMGSCGTAAFRKRLIICSDIASDPLWSEHADYQRIAIGYGLRAAWSQPLVANDGEVLGTFAMYYEEPRPPNQSDLELIEGAAHVALIAIQGERAHAALDKALNEAKTSEAQLRKIIDTIPTLAWRTVADGSADYFNQRWHEYTGLSPQEAHGAGWQITIHPEDVRRTMDRWLQEILPSVKPGEIEVRLRRFDGAYRWFLVRIAPLCDEEGNVVRWYGTNTDIEDRKRAEERLRQDERELRLIVDAITQTVVVLKPDGTTLYANQAMLGYTGLTLEEVLAPDFRARVFHPDDVERLREGRGKALSGRVSFENEQRILGKDGQYRWFLIRFNPLRDEKGQVLRWYATGIDIDDRKRAEERVQNENLALREEIDRSSMFEEIVGSSETLRHVLSEVARVAPSDSTVLILGETGTGKELIARAIHKQSNRASRAFIRVNCAAIPSSLIASELFGHEKGAFTGAVQKRVGRFEAAHGGTILLDEVSELPADTQISLLRVLQEREFERIGSNQAISVDVRVLAATNRDLGAAVAAGSFRQDLFYRLNVFPIQLPSLRERADDIPLLVEYLIDRYAKKAGKKIRRINKRTLEWFQAYHWPGNVRELQNVVERAVILCDGDTFSVDRSWLQRESNRASAPVSLAATLAQNDQESAQRERDLIEAALAACHGRISGPYGAAARLNMPRQTLDSRIKALGINKYLFKAA